VARLLERCVIERGARHAAAVAELPPASSTACSRKWPVAIRAPTRVLRWSARPATTLSTAFRHKRLPLGRARRLGAAHAAEVHTLASAYGWSEAQILALSATRRQRYIALVQG
jgi:hypothetical protein